VWRAGAAPAGESTTDQASAIAADHEFYIAYGSAWHIGEGLHFGNALLSRYPIAESAVFELPGRETDESRSLLYARVEHPRGALPVFVTHLNWKLHQGSTRLKQVGFIADRVKELAPIKDDFLPPVLMGDFNAEPDSDEMRFLRGLATVEGRSVYFADAWISAGDGPGYTFDRRNRFAAIAHEPPRRIDYIFVRGPDRMLRGEPVATRLAFADGVDGTTGPTWPSDHFGVVTDLVVEPRAVA
jgi:endonuclease/exonuclease/phosphatase family metal-dependent hydrolase